ncbi:Transglycosylase SLT domain-containing protein [Rhizobiales bacterium GAS191]|jgi:soluble lytic murein transglycosylase-like protein|nr:Transglycosylase SLT domain-containing protein [Rhizobiales bacterium GAS113]SEE56860.1 Transglycosylase SLT domain-containing protein [Rhizobiales bacterium GAS191]
MRLSSSACFAVIAALLAGCADLAEGVSPSATQGKAEAAAAGEQAESPNKEMAEGVDAKARARQLRPVIERHAHENAIPVGLANAVIRIESNYSARIVHAGNYGLMQIKLATARSLGFAGSPAALLDPDTNLHFGLKYLGGAYQQADGDVCRTVMKYQSGHLAFRMSAANRIYCQRVKSLMAS